MRGHRLIPCVNGGEILIGTSRPLSFSVLVVQIVTRSAPAAQPSAASGGQPDPAHVFVALVVRSIDFYRELGCEVRLVADGWVQLSHDGTVIVLEQAAARVPPMTAPLVRLECDDLHALRGQLLTRGIATRGTAAGRGPAREFELVDPDGHLVVVSESPKHC